MAAAALSVSSKKTDSKVHPAGATALPHSAGIACKILCPQTGLHMKRLGITFCDVMLGGWQTPPRPFHSIIRKKVLSLNSLSVVTVMIGLVLGGHRMTPCHEQNSEAPGKEEMG